MAVLKMLDSAATKPSPRRRTELHQGHHLYWEKHKGWFTRVTISMGTKLVGKRVKVRLYTKNDKVAIERRPLVIAAYKRLGLTVCTRIQRGRKAEKSGGKTPPPREGASSND